MSESHEPIPLKKRASLHHEWFNREPRHSRPSSTIPPPPVVLPSRARTVLAGALVGAVAGPIAIAVARVLAHRELVDAIAYGLSRGDLHGLPKDVWAFGIAAVIGAVIATVIALLTRHVRRALPIAIFGVVFAPVVWLGLHVLALRHHAWLVTEALPVGPMIMGTAVFGVLLSMIVPIRGR